MSFRRDSVSAVRWMAFRNKTRDLAANAGLPENHMDTQFVFMDFLMHGCIRGDTRRFYVQELTQEQFGSFVDLVREYFRSGHDYFTPQALVYTDLMQQFDEEFANPDQQKEEANKTRRSNHH